MVQTQKTSSLALLLLLLLRFLDSSTHLYKRLCPSVFRNKFWSMEASMEYFPFFSLHNKDNEVQENILVNQNQQNDVEYKGRRFIISICSNYAKYNKNLKKLNEVKLSVIHSGPVIKQISRKGCKL